MVDDRCPVCGFWVCVCDDDLDEHEAHYYWDFVDVEDDDDD